MNTLEEDHMARRNMWERKRSGHEENRSSSRPAITVMR